MKRVLMLTGLVVAVFMITGGYAQEAGNAPEINPGADIDAGEYVSGAEMAEGMKWATDEILGVDIGKVGNADIYLEHGADLNLTDSQITQLKRIQQVHEGTVSQPDEELQSLEGELHDMVTADNPDMGNIKEKVREVQEARAERLITEIEYAVESRDILNADQRSLAIDLSVEQFDMTIPSPEERIIPDSGRGGM